MGTHPIFESDFDCLTERNQKHLKMTDVLNWDTVRMEAVEIVLKGWTALDLQIQHNPHHSEIRKWLPEPISTALKDKPYADELEEWLMQLLDTNFSLVCEDDSCYEVARHLVNIEDLIGRQDKDKLVDYMKNLPQSSGASKSLFEQRDDDSSDDENSSPNNMPPPRAPKPKVEEEEDMDVEDGWSVVRK